MAIRSLSVPFGDGQCFALPGMRIATACGLAMTCLVWLVLLDWRGNGPGWSAWAVPHALRGKSGGACTSAPGAWGYRRCILRNGHNRSLQGWTNVGRAALPPPTPYDFQKCSIESVGNGLRAVPPMPMGIGKNRPYRGGGRFMNRPYSSKTKKGTARGRSLQS